MAAPRNGPAPSVNGAGGSQSQPPPPPPPLPPPRHPLTLAASLSTSRTPIAQVKARSASTQGGGRNDGGPAATQSGGSATPSPGSISLKVRFSGTRKRPTATLVGSPSDSGPANASTRPELIKASGDLVRAAPPPPRDTTASALSVKLASDTASESPRTTLARRKRGQAAPRSPQTVTASEKIEVPKSTASGPSRERKAGPSSNGAAARRRRPKAGTTARRKVAEPSQSVPMKVAPQPLQAEPEEGELSSDLSSVSDSDEPSPFPFSGRPSIEETTAHFHTILAATTRRQSRASGALDRIGRAAESKADEQGQRQSPASSRDGPQRSSEEGDQERVTQTALAAAHAYMQAHQPDHVAGQEREVTDLSAALASTQIQAEPGDVTGAGNTVENNPLPPAEVSAQVATGTTQADTPTRDSSNTITVPAQPPDAAPPRQRPNTSEHSEPGASGQRAIPNVDIGNATVATSADPEHHVEVVAEDASRPHSELPRAATPVPENTMEGLWGSFDMTSYDDDEPPVWPPAASQTVQIPQRAASLPMQRSEDIPTAQSESVADQPGATKPTSLPTEDSMSNDTMVVVGPSGSRFRTEDANTRRGEAPSRTDNEKPVPTGQPSVRAEDRPTRMDQPLLRIGDQGSGLSSAELDDAEKSVGMLQNASSSSSVLGKPSIRDQQAITQLSVSAADTPIAALRGPERPPGPTHLIPSQVHPPLVHDDMSLPFTMPPAEPESVPMSLDPQEEREADDSPTRQPAAPATPAGAQEQQRPATPAAVLGQGAPQDNLLSSRATESMTASNEDQSRSQIHSEAGIDEIEGASSADEVEAASSLELATNLQRTLTPSGSSKTRDIQGTAKNLASSPPVSGETSTFRKLSPAQEDLTQSPLEDLSADRLRSPTSSEDELTSLPPEEMTDLSRSPSDPAREDRTTDQAALASEHEQSRISRAGSEDSPRATDEAELSALSPKGELVEELDASQSAAEASTSESGRPGAVHLPPSQRASTAEDLFSSRPRRFVEVYVPIPRRARSFTPRDAERNAVQFSSNVPTTRDEPSDEESLSTPPADQRSTHSSEDDVEHPATRTSPRREAAKKAVMAIRQRRASLQAIKENRQRQASREAADSPLSELTTSDSEDEDEGQGKESGRAAAESDAAPTLPSSRAPAALGNARPGAQVEIIEESEPPHIGRKLHFDASENRGRDELDADVVQQEAPISGVEIAVVQEAVDANLREDATGVERDDDSASHTQDFSNSNSAIVLDPVDEAPPPPVSRVQHEPVDRPHEVSAFQMLNPAISTTEALRQLREEQMAIRQERAWLTEQSELEQRQDDAAGSEPSEHRAEVTAAQAAFEGEMVESTQDEEWAQPRAKAAHRQTSALTANADGRRLGEFVHTLLEHKRASPPRTPAPLEQTSPAKRAAAAINGGAERLTPVRKVSESPRGIKRKVSLSTPPSSLTTVRECRKFIKRLERPPPLPHPLQRVSMTLEEAQQEFLALLAKIVD
ncbi:unnamed protein product [Parajaminaea phylloscopi]